MSDLKPELSKENPYHINKHRYYELKHFCRQYPDWKKQLKLMEPPLTPEFVERFEKASKLPNPTERIAIMRAALTECCEQVEEAARQSDHDLAKWILLGVTEGLSFEELSMVRGMPCGRDMYYDCYRKFFWVLSRIRT